MPANAAREDAVHGMDWSHLQFFAEVARTGTLSEAARRLRADHATVGRRIDALEQQLGVKLFERQPRGYGLTRHGERLLAVADAMAREAARADEAFGGAGGPGLRGVVRLSTLEGFGNFFLVPRLEPLIGANPALEIEWLTIQQIVALSRREADIAVTLLPPPSGRYQSERLTDYRLMVYGARRYLDAHAPIRGVEDLRHHRFSGYIDDLVFTRGLDYLDELAGGTIRATLQNSSLAAQLSATLAGLCLCVLPLYVAASHPDLVPVLPDRLFLTRTYWMTVAGGVADTARIRHVRDFIRDTVSAHRPLFTG
ncbi:LysR family transcriptional regulator [Rhizosaccharibacter radicis]|uniref:LysR family transcriptional regulator n=1 Tax=Rhizosaccharibacter radicis TaxID=2782605 RepID=A0ABT1VUD3_9PROT|nr:LysR family transcriptional regulator [Acetobacteraceae bacterium KSS12]